MSKKLLSVLLALMLVLGCTVMAGAETVTVNEYADDPILSQMDADLLDEVKEAVIATLPEDMQDKEYTLTSNGDETGESIALVCTETAYPVEVQALIDEGAIDESYLEMPEGYSAQVCISDVIVPIVEDDDGNLVNPLSNSYTSTSVSSGWQGGSENSMSVSARVTYTRYTDSTNSLWTAVRPITIQSTYTNSSSTSITRLYCQYTAAGSWVHFPGYVNGTDRSTIDHDPYVYQLIVDSPSASVIYSESMGFSSSYAIATGNHAFRIMLYSGSTLKLETNPGWWL